MKTNTIWFVLVIIFFACAKNGIEPDDNKNIVDLKNEFWTIPLLEATILYFRLSDSVQIDSVLAGKIQFRLDLAKLVDDTLSDFSVAKDWELGKLLLFTTNELHSSFDTTTCTFGYQPLDSLLKVYEIRKGEKKRDMLRLFFPTYYNMRILSDIFGNVKGIKAAEPNDYGSIGICDKDISLEVVDNLYKFTFSIIGSCGRHFWEVNVINDYAELVADY